MPFPTRCFRAIASLGGDNRDLLHSLGGPLTTPTTKCALDPDPRRGRPAAIHPSLRAALSPGTPYFSALLEGPHVVAAAPCERHLMVKVVSPPRRMDRTACGIAPVNHGLRVNRMIDTPGSRTPSARWRWALTQLRPGHSVAGPAAGHLVAHRVDLDRTALETMAADECRFADVTNLGVDKNIWHHVSGRPI